MNRAAFNIYIEIQLAPTLAPGDVVILDNLSVHKSARTEEHGCPSCPNTPQT
jgi:alpha-ketoglutarate-dependent taurine dioxygenase